MSQDLLEQKELWNVGAGATTTTIPMVTQSGLSVALSAASQAQLAGSTFDCAIGATRCMAIVNSVSASGVLTLDSPLPSVPAQSTQFVLTPTREMSLAGSNATIGNVGNVSNNLILLNAVAITDTNTHSAISIDISKFPGRKTITIHSTLNQNITTLEIALRNAGLATGYIYKNTALVIVGSALVSSDATPSSTDSSLVPIQVPQLADAFLQISLVIQCAIAPTSGSVTVALQG